MQVEAFFFFFFCCEVALIPVLLLEPDFGTACDGLCFSLTGVDCLTLACPCEGLLYKPFDDCLLFDCFVSCFAELGSLVDGDSIFAKLLTLISCVFNRNTFHFIPNDLPN